MHTYTEVKASQRYIDSCQAGGHVQTISDYELPKQHAALGLPATDLSVIAESRKDWNSSWSIDVKCCECFCVKGLEFLERSKNWSEHVWLILDLLLVGLISLKQ